MTLLEFLEARLAEDERIARATAPTWESYELDDCSDHDAQPHTLMCGWRLGESLRDKCECAYPARVLREVAAKRAIIDLARMTEANIATTEALGHAPQVAAYRYIASGLFDAIAALASVYTNHPDYRQEWAL